MKKDEIIKILKAKKEYFIQKYGIEIIGIFGSYARGKETKNSDIDILYRFKNKKIFGLFEYLKAIDELESFLKCKVDLIRENIVKPEIKKYIKKDLVNV